MSGSVVMDNRLFKRGIEAMMKQYGHSAGDVMRRQMSIASGQLAKRYPPHGPGGMKTNSLKHGKQAIRNDMLKIFVPIKSEDYDDLKEWEEDYKGLRDVFDYDGQKIEEWRAKHFSQRTQRIGNSIKGNWQGYGRRFSNKMHIRESDFEKKIKELNKRVGKLAGAWTAGTKRWSGAGPMAWRTKYSNNGRAIDRMDKKGNGYLEIQNMIEGSARWKRIDQFVMRSREKGFQKELKAVVKKADKAGNAVR